VELQCQQTGATTKIKRFDLIVIGAGLAGSAVAWQAYARGLRVAIIDRQEPQTSSRIAAGLVTPITGSRAASSWGWDEFFPVADDFYRRIERLTAQSLWHCRPAWRVYRSRLEQEQVENKWISEDRMSEEISHSRILVQHIDVGSDKGVIAPWGACSMEPATRLDTELYLDATKSFFESRETFLVADIDCNHDVCLSEDGLVSVSSLGLKTGQLVLCQGVGARSNHWFASLPLHPARGDILCVASNQLATDNVLHADAWTVPIGNQHYLVGATYDRTNKAGDDSHNDAESLRFRQQLIDRFEAIAVGTFSNGDHRLVSQRSAIRPASYDRHPLIGRHPQVKNIHCLNGLGSKGTLMAPLLAIELLDSIVRDQSVRSSVQWNRR
jgi:glycine/D-amino acid oxidase-like deaminating enzyme